MSRMTGADYRRMLALLRRTPRREAAAKALCRFLPAIPFVSYGASALMLLSRRDRALLPFVGIPAAGFLFVTAVRARINAPRPYDDWHDYAPLLPVRRGKGKSFPSRHTASAFIIAFACLWLHPIFGAAMLLAAVLIGASRVLAGLHYPRDVLAAAAVSCAFGALFLLFDRVS